VAAKWQAGLSRAIVVGALLYIRPDLELLTPYDIFALEFPRSCHHLAARRRDGYSLSHE
jgi:hypothetical protein